MPPMTPNLTLSQNIDYVSNKSTQESLFIQFASQCNVSLLFEELTASDLQCSSPKTIKSKLSNGFQQIKMDLENLPTAINSPENDEDENNGEMESFPARKNSERLFRSSKTLFSTKKPISKLHKR